MKKIISSIHNAWVDYYMYPDYDPDQERTSRLSEYFERDPRHRLTMQLILTKANIHSIQKRLRKNSDIPNGNTEQQKLHYEKDLVRLNKKRKTALEGLDKTAPLALDPTKIAGLSPRIQHPSLEPNYTQPPPSEKLEENRAKLNQPLPVKWAWHGDGIEYTVESKDPDTVIITPL